MGWLWECCPSQYSQRVVAPACIIRPKEAGLVPDSSRKAVSAPPFPEKPLQQHGSAEDARVQSGGGSISGKLPWGLAAQETVLLNLTLPSGGIVQAFSVRGQLLRVPDRDRFAGPAAAAHRGPAGDVLAAVVESAAVLFAEERRGKAAQDFVRRADD